MADYKTVKDLELNGKRVLTRLDLNVPIKEGVVKDYTRINAIIETVKYITDKGGKAILMSHLGRPGGERNMDFTLKPVAKALTEKLEMEVKIAPDCIGEEVEEIVNNMQDGEVLLLENLRFHNGETENNPEFVEKLSRLADVYVNDAFGTAHRAQGSTYGVCLKLQEENKEVAAGLLMDKELEIWRPIVEGTGKGVAIVAGAKLKEKVKAAKKFASKFDRVILGGVTANVFLKAKGIEIGASKYLEKDKDYTELAKEVLESSGDKIILPSKVTLASKEFERKGESDPQEGVDDELLIADVLLTEADQEAIKEAERVVWFGPMGAYELGFKEGSLEVVDAINASKGYAVLGGGDLAAAAQGINAKVSTGGGASIQYITKGMLQALEALKGNKV
ncbi:MAG: phosphoglycerate kinase [Candidatus Kariarchaeaceae archaeon]